MRAAAVNDSSPRSAWQDAVNAGAPPPQIETPPADETEGDSEPVPKPKSTRSVYQSEIEKIKAPKDLAKLHQWLCWRFEKRPSESKPRKMPYYADGARRFGKQGRPEELPRFVAFEEVRKAAISGHHNGVGIAMVEGCGYTVVDFDNCVDKQGTIHSVVLAAVTGTYAEYSPSRKGIHAIVKGNLGNAKSHDQDGTHGFGMELFSTKGFVTFTGNVLPDVEDFGDPDHIAKPSNKMLALIRERFESVTPDVARNGDPLDEEEPLGLTEKQLESVLGVLSPDMGHDDWLHVGMGLHHETSGFRFDLWDAWSCTSNKYPDSEALAKRWDSFDESSGRAVTFRSVLRLAKAEGFNTKALHAELKAAADASLNDQFDDVTSSDPQDDDPGAADGADDFNESSSEAPTDKPEAMRFNLEHASAIVKMPTGNWLIKGLMPDADLILGIGAPGSGKSFAFMEMGLALARGVEYRGHRVKHKRKVVLIAAEGAGGVGGRLQAYAEQHQVSMDDIDFHVIRAAPNFLLAQDISDIIAAIRKQMGRCDLLLVDTFAQVTPGSNENSGEDMGMALANCKLLRRKTGATVMLIHHIGKVETKGARGWSGLNGAADAVLTIARDKSGLRHMTVAKMKDGMDGGRYWFDLQTVELGVDEDGDEVTSCICEPVDAPEPTATVKPMGKWERLVLEVISEFALGATAGIEVQAVVDETARRGDAPEAGKRDTRKQHAKRALAKLAEAGTHFVLEGDNKLTVTGQ